MLTEAQAIQVADTLNDEQAALLIEVHLGLNRMLDAAELSIVEELEACSLIEHDASTGARRTTWDGEAVALALR